jgi:hypothetical protein
MRRTRAQSTERRRCSPRRSARATFRRVDPLRGLPPGPLTIDVTVSLASIMTDGSRAARTSRRGGAAGRSNRSSGWRAGRPDERAAGQRYPVCRPSHRRPQPRGRSDCLRRSQAGIDRGAARPRFRPCDLRRAGRVEHPDRHVTPTEAPPTSEMVWAGGAAASLARQILASRA